MDALHNKKEDKLSESQSAQLTGLATLGMGSLALLGHAYHSVSLRRRELQKPDVAWKYHPLFEPEVEDNQYLYGGKENVEKVFTEVGTMSQVLCQSRTDIVTDTVDMDNTNTHTHIQEEPLLQGPQDVAGAGGLAGDHTQDLEEVETY